MNNKLVLLSRSELNYLLNNKQFSKSFEYKIKCLLKKKIAIFLQNELPLLLESGLIDIKDLEDYINKNNMLPILGKEKVEGSNPAQGFSFVQLFRYFHCLTSKDDSQCYCIY